MDLRITGIKVPEEITITLSDDTILSLVDSAMDDVKKAKTIFKAIARAMREADRQMAHRLTLEEILGARSIVRIYNKAYQGRFSYISQEEMSLADQRLIGFELGNGCERRFDAEDTELSECCHYKTTIARDVYPYENMGPIKFYNVNTLYLVQVCLWCKRRIEWIRYAGDIDTDAGMLVYHSYRPYSYVSMDSFQID